MRPESKKISIECVSKNKESVRKSRAIKEETTACHASESAKSLIL